MSNLETQVKQAAEAVIWHKRATLIAGAVCLILGLVLGHLL